MVSQVQIKEALLIRRVEETFMDLFSQGKLNGTVHTCVGQEMSAVAFAGQLNKQDFVFSNHRCHGHYISFTKDHYGLIAELLGKKDGVCGGVGSSQHLHNDNFYSNGIQSGIVPLAAGMALANKLKKNGNIGIVFIGDGTLGEGVLYETLNIISLWKLPLIVVCENNSYAQSTSQKDGLAGDILKRAEAFSIRTFESDTWDAESLVTAARNSIDHARKSGQPVFHLVNTYRLNAHSKGDDDRDQREIESYREKDYLVRFSKSEPETYKKYLDEINAAIKEAVRTISTGEELAISDYLEPKAAEKKEKTWKNVPVMDQRQVNLINKFFDGLLKKDKKALFMGEDVLSPYGGAFKVAKGLSEKHPGQVITTPISEAAITGIGVGLAISGFKPFVEIMFGDFITLAMDQMINHASKLYHMYNKKVNCPLVIRTPMGGGRGYGPTHSQSLERFLIGIDNVKVIALNSLIDPGIVYDAVNNETGPVIVIENKSDYGKYVGSHKAENYRTIVSDDEYPVVKFVPLSAEPNLTIVTYGGMVKEVVESLQDLFLDHDFKPEVIVLTKIDPIDYDDILGSVRTTKRLAVVEEGSSVGGVSSEIIANISERASFHFEALKIGALQVPIPSVRSLEEKVLPNKESIIRSIAEKFK